MRVRAERLWAHRSQGEIALGIAHQLCICYATYARQSPRMAAWQGPALLAYNDAVFR